MYQELDLIVLVVLVEGLLIAIVKLFDYWQVAESSKK